MKINLLFSALLALFFAAANPSLSAASSAGRSPHLAVSAVQAEKKEAAPTHYKKEKRSGKLKKWWAKQALKLQKLKRWAERISLGFLGFIVMLVGGLFIVLGIVVPVVGLLFVVIGILIAFVGLLLWLVLSRIGVRVEAGERRRRNYN